jgi:hypothetical protein
MTETQDRIAARAIDQRGRLTLAALRIMNGTAGGMPRRKLDTHDRGAFTGIVDAMLTYYHQQLPRREG